MYSYSVVESALITINTTILLLVKQKNMQLNMTMHVGCVLTLVSTEIYK